MFRKFNWGGETETPGARYQKRSPVGNFKDIDWDQKSLLEEIKIILMEQLLIGQNLQGGIKSRTRMVESRPITRTRMVKTKTKGGRRDKI
jgi:hypothetical protein